MKAFSIFFAGFLFCYLACTGQVYQHKYPAISESDVPVNRFGIEFSDPYTSLENVESDTTAAWLNAENKLLDQYRRASYAQYTICERTLNNSYIDFNPRKGINIKDDIYFAIRRDAFGIPSVYFRRSYKDPFQKMCYLGDFSYGKNDRIFVRHLAVSPHEKYLAITYSHGGSDWRHVRIWDIEGEKFLPEDVDWLKFNPVVWAEDGFFYSRFDAPPNEHDLNTPDKNERVMFHKIGTSPSTDRVILSASDKNAGFIYFHRLAESKKIILEYTRQEKNKRVKIIAYLNYDSAGAAIKEFIMAPDDGTRPFTVVGIENGQFLVKSTFRAPNGQVLLYDPEQVNSGRLLIEQYSQPIRSVSILKDRIFCIYFDMGRFIPVVFDTAGHVLKKLDIPDGFSVSGFTKALNDSVTYYVLSSFETYPRALKFDFKNLNSILYDANIGVLFESRFSTDLVYFTSKDSTRIPMYLVHLKTLKPDTSTPALLYAYGGFDLSTDPQYNPGFCLFMNMGGIVAFPLIRGGGELGEKWHKGGMKLNKQKSFDDFIGAAEYLIANKYTSPEKIAIHGGSNGGLLVAAAMVERPELFKVVVPQAAVLDLVNFPKYNMGTQVGVNEYGNPDDSLEFRNLYNLSPLHHIKKDVEYPATMLIASWNDNRVPPSNSFRFLAELQNHVKSKWNPYLLYLEENEGHLQEGTFDDFEREALMYTFIFENLGVDVNQLH